MAAITSDDPAEVKVTLDQLGVAMGQAATALAALDRMSPADTFRTVASALNALASAPDLFSAIASLLAPETFGPDAAKVMAQCEERLAELAAASAPHRQQLADLLASEQRLRDAEREQAELTHQIAALSQLERVADRLDELRAYRDALKNQTAAVARAIGDASADITAGGERLAALTAELLDAIDAKAREALRRAREQDRLLEARIAERRAAAERSAQDSKRLRAEVSAAETRAESADRQLQQVRSELSGRLADLRRHTEADNAVLAALSSYLQTGSDSERSETSDARLALDDIQLRLAEIDAVLAEALKSRDRAQVGASTQAVGQPPILPRTSQPAGEEQH